MEWKTFWYILVLGYSPIQIYAQNLVENGDFEIFGKYVPYNHFGNDTVFPKGWDYGIGFGSPDYYRINNPDRRLSVPINWYGFHPAQTGHAYIGFYPFSRDGGTEHILGTLKSPLKIHEEYDCKIWLRYAGNCCAYSLDRLEIMFFENPDILLKRMDANYRDFADQNDYPQVVIENRNILSDTAWTCVVEKFIANANYRYFVIGIFYQHQIHKKLISQINKYRSIRVKESKENISLKFDNVTTKLLLSPNFNYKGKCIHKVIEPYYFIDNVSVCLSDSTP